MRERRSDVPTRAYRAHRGAFVNALPGTTQSRPAHATSPESQASFRNTGPRKGLVRGSVTECRWCLAADNRGCFVDQVVVGERLDHEENEVCTAGDVALKDRIADVPAPDGRPWLSPSAALLLACT